MSVADHRTRTGTVLMKRPTMSRMPGTSASRPETVEPRTTSLLPRTAPRVTAHALCTATLREVPAARAAASTSSVKSAATSANRPEGVWPSATREGPGRPASSSPQTRSLSSWSRPASQAT